MTADLGSSVMLKWLRWAALVLGRRGQRLCCCWIVCDTKNVNFPSVISGWLISFGFLHLLVYSPSFLFEVQYKIV